MSDQGDRARSGIAPNFAPVSVRLAVCCALACAVGSAWANPCPQVTVGGVTGYISLTGTQVVSVDSIDATGVASACLIDGGTLEVAGTLTNNGSLSLSSNGGLLAIDAPATLNNVGTFSALAGTVSNNGAISNSGVFGTTAATLDNNLGATFGNLAGGQATLSGPATNAGQIANDGVFSITGTTAIPGLLTSTGSIANSATGTFGIFLGATLDSSGAVANAGAFQNTGFVSNRAGATFTNTGAGIVQNGDPTGAAGGTWTNAGTLANVGAGAAFNNNAGSTITNTGTLSNQGGTLTNAVGGTVQNQSGATFASQLGGTIVNQGTLSTAGTLQNDGNFNNSGTVQVSGAITGSGHYAQTAGLTKLLGGSIAQASIDIQGGQLLGTGTLTGAVTLGAGATLGAGDPQTLTVHGALNLGAGTLLVQIAGSGAGQYDVVNVTGGAASLAGTNITFQFLAGYAPLPGVTTFAGFLTADGGITGLSTATYTFLGLSQPLPFSVVANGTGLDLALTGPVPEPRSVALFLAGLALVVRRAYALRCRHPASAPTLS